VRRDPRLHGLSADHRRALGLASRLARLAAEGRLDAATVWQLRVEFDAALAPHFAIEEELLLPALRNAGGGELARRTQAEHDELRAHLTAAEAGELARVAAFAALLTAHVRFEERDLFPACEARLDASVLDAVAARTPKARRNSS